VRGRRTEQCVCELLATATIDACMDGCVRGLVGIDANAFILGVGGVRLSRKASRVSITPVSTSWLLYGWADGWVFLTPWSVSLQRSHLPASRVRAGLDCQRTSLTVEYSRGCGRKGRRMPGRRRAYHYGRNRSFSIMDVLVRCRPPFVGAMDVVERIRVTFICDTGAFEALIAPARVCGGTSFAVGRKSPDTQ